MKSIPSAAVLADDLKRSFINKILEEAKLSLSEYSDMVAYQTIVLRKQILTEQGYSLLTTKEHEKLLNNLLKNYPLLFSKSE